MRISIGQIRSIIKEEAARVVSAARGPEYGYEDLVAIIDPEDGAVMPGHEKEAEMIVAYLRDRNIDHRDQLLAAGMDEQSADLWMDVLSGKHPTSFGFRS